MSSSGHYLSCPDEMSLLVYILTEINSQRYKIGNLLGEGAFGAVYEGSRLKDGLKVSSFFF